MALSIKSDEAERLVRQMSAETGETLTEAVVVALRQRLERVRAARAAGMSVRLRKLQSDVSALPVLDSRAPEETLGYGSRGLPS